jgi:hypothetical protein
MKLNQQYSSSEERGNWRSRAKGETHIKPYNLIEICAITRIRRQYGEREMMEAVKRRESP